MIRLAFLWVFFVTLSGCATTHHGHFSTLPAGCHQVMANDTVNQIVALYPPALTHFNIKQSVKDPFGLLLVELLRKKGYSLDESTIYGQNTQGFAAISLHYVVDEPIKNTLYRVSIMVGNQSISRAYTFKNSVIKPSGFWVRKE